MSAISIFTIISLYFVLLLVISYFTGRHSNNDSFFVGNRQSPWFVVAFGMIGASLSGVTFMSVPGEVGTKHFSYLIMVFGYWVGYIVIATVLLPLYYRLNLVSIYTYLNQRFGFWSYKTGAFFFLISRILGASLRMYIVINVLQLFVFDAWNIPFWITVLFFIALVILYTFKGGVKTIIWTDTLQTVFMLLSLGLTIYFITKNMDLNLSQLVHQVMKSEKSQLLFFDWHDKQYFLKQFLSGMFITIVMTGLDQEMMQKNLSCRTIKDAQKNMFTFSFILIVVNALFLFLGAILYLFAEAKGMNLPKTSDDLFPIIALRYLGPIAGIAFVIGLISAAFPSADGALTSLTSSFSIDFLGLNERNISEEKKKKIRYRVHLSFALILLLVIIVFKAVNDQSVLSKLFTVAGYTYGPLLGLYAFGLFFKREVRDRLVPFICIASPILCFLLSYFSIDLLNGYKFGFELLIINGILTFLGLLMISKK